MKIKLSEYASLHTIYEEVYHHNFHTQDELEESEKQIQTHHYQIKLKEKWFEGVHISWVKMAIPHAQDFLYESSAYHIGFLFCLDGKICIKHADHIDHSFSIHPNQYYILSGRLQPLVINVVENASYVYLHLTTSYFKKLTNQVLKDQEVEQNIFTPEVYLWLNRLKSHSYQGRVERIFLESKILELMIIYLQRRNAPSSSLKEDDLKKIMLARQFIENDLQHPGSLLEISRKAGINDFKLKKGFKILTGYTVFGYLYKLRMEKAHFLLLQEKKSVNEVAFLVGYKNAQHFITAFKKQYQVSPGSLNKNLKHS